MTHEYSRKLDKDLLDIKNFCYPDAPKEFIVVSEDTILSKEESTKKTNEEAIVRGRHVEIIRDPQLGGKLVVVIKRTPKNTLLTYSEVYEILQEIEETLGVKIKWRRPFPRGSC